MTPVFSTPPSGGAWIGCPRDHREGERSQSDSTSEQFLLDEALNRAAFGRRDVVEHERGLADAAIHGAAGDLDPAEGSQIEVQGHLLALLPRRLLAPQETAVPRERDHLGVPVSRVAPPCAGQAR